MFGGRIKTILVDICKDFFITAPKSGIKCLG